MTFDASGNLQSYSVDGGATTRHNPARLDLDHQALPTGFNWNEKAIKFDLPAPGSSEPSPSTRLTRPSRAPPRTATHKAASSPGRSDKRRHHRHVHQRPVTAARHNRPRELLKPGGLENIGNLEYQTTAASGQPQVARRAGRTGTLLGGALEQSNVDLANQLTGLIEAQTDYEADTKVVSRTETALQALVTNA